MTQQRMVKIKQVDTRTGKVTEIWRPAHPGELPTVGAVVQVTPEMLAEIKRTGKLPAPLAPKKEDKK